MAKKKGFLKSRTIWVNIIALVAAILSEQFGWNIDGQAKFAILVGVNMVLRAITKQEITWFGDE